MQSMALLFFFKLIKHVILVRWLWCTHSPKITSIENDHTNCIVSVSIHKLLPLPIITESHCSEIESRSTAKKKYRKKGRAICRLYLPSNIVYVWLLITTKRSNNLYPRVAKLRSLRSLLCVPFSSSFISLPLAHSLFLVHTWFHFRSILLVNFSKHLSHASFSVSAKWLLLLLLFTRLFISMKEKDCRKYTKIYRAL